jgi:hypothetical protein
LLAVVDVSEPAERTARLNEFWSKLRDAGQVPYVQGNQVAFLYRGTANGVAWPGDFHCWNPQTPG